MKSSVIHPYFFFLYKLLFSNMEKALNGIEFKKVVGERIVALRNSKGLSQEQLAECLGINQRSLSDLETGKSLPSADTFASLFEFFNIEPHELFNFPVFKNAKTAEKEIYKKIATVKDNKELLIKIYMYLLTVI